VWIATHDLESSIPKISDRASLRSRRLLFARFFVGAATARVTKSAVERRRDVLAHRRVVGARAMQRVREPDGEAALLERC